MIRKFSPSARGAMDFDQIGKYRIRDKIGHGAMGEVYKAEDTFLNRFVAVKVMAASLAGDSDLRERFFREAQSAALLNHPNIITVYDCGEERGRIYIAMELLEGKDLKELIGKKAVLDLHQKLDIMEQICSGLAMAHSKEIFHRDIKPANIHVQPGGHVKIMDFGLARLSSSEMTKTGMVMGTPHYMSPEQVKGEKVDARSDVFSLGAVFYELLSSHKPFDGDSLHTILFHVLQHEPEPLRGLVELPSIVVELVEKALCKDPARRFQNGKAMLEAVQAVGRALAEGREGEATLESELGPEAPVVDTGAAAGRAAWAPGDRRVVGNVALEPVRAAERAMERTKRPAQTLPGAPATPLEGARGRRPGPAAAPSRWPVYAAVSVVAVVAVMAGAFFAFRAMRAPAPASAPPANGAAREQIGALTQALVGNQVELARKKLQDKNYRGAQAQAERALKLDPESADAKQVLEQAQGRLTDLEAAAEESRAALKAGDTAKASAALWKVLSIDPNDAAVDELTGPLNRSFRPQAEEARRLMSQARASAEQVKAGSIEAFTEAMSLSGKAEALFTRGEYAQAARKFLDARDGFDRARRLAQR